MKIQRIAVWGVLCLLLGTVSAVAAEAEAVDGMLCVTDQGTETPDALMGDRVGTAGLRAPVPKCPVNFSNCADVPGRSCRLQQCVTVDLGYAFCKKPGGHIIGCTNGNLQQTTCDCLERLHQICCDDGSCSFGECGVCTGGSLTTVCP